MCGPYSGNNRDRGQRHKPGVERQHPVAVDAPDTHPISQVGHDGQAGSGCRLARRTAPPANLDLEQDLSADSPASASHEQRGALLRLGSAGSAELLGPVRAISTTETLMAALRAPSCPPPQGRAAAHCQLEGRAGVG